MQRWKKVLIIIGSVLTFIVAAAWILALVYEDQVKNMIITNINSKLKIPVHVKDIDFSFIRKFPSATLEFTDIMAEGLTYNEIKKPLLQAHKLNLNFSLWDVFSDKVSIKKIEITGGSSFIYIMRNGEANYDVWKSEGSSGANSGLDLKDVLLNDMQIVYRNDITVDDYSMRIKNANVAGSFSSEQFDLTVRSDMKVEHFIADKVNYLLNKDVVLDLITHVNTTTKLYQLKKAELTIADLVLNTEGTIQTTDKGNMINLKVKSDKAGIKEMLSLVPKEYINNTDDYRFDGTATFTAQITGLSGKSSTPLITADFTANNATIISKGSDHKLNGINLKGSYVNRRGKNNPVSFLSFSQISAMLDNQPVRGSLTIENLADPFITMSANGNLDLAVASSFYKPDTLQSVSGNLLLNMQFRGRAENNASYQSSGSVTMQNVSFIIKDQPAVFSQWNGTFVLDGNRFSINNVTGKAAGSDLAFNGSINNLFSFLFQPNQILSGSAQLTSRNLDLNEILQDKAQTTSGDTAYYLDISNNFNFLLELNIGVISFKKFQAWNMKGDVAVRNRNISSNGLSFKSSSGSWNITGMINAAPKDSILISCSADLKNIDINELFTEMGNFGQDVITDKNLRGKLTADINFAGMWSKTLTCNTDKMVVQSKFTIEQGELLKFEPMMALSKYIKGADLQNIKFNTLKNTIEIRNRKIFIPAMEIKSTALEMTASGTHSFDNIVDYKIQLLLSQLVGKKVKQMNTEFGTIEDDGLGRTKLFLSMTGPVSNPKIKYDSKGVEQKIVQEVKVEKQNLKTILNKEFGWFKKDSVVKTQEPPKKKKEELQIEREE